MINKIGIIEKLLTGEYQSPFSRKNIKIPIEEIVITPSVLINITKILYKLTICKTY
jgi:hypothetical protein